MDMDWDWSGAEVQFRRALELSPNSAEAHYRYALLLSSLLRTAEALAEIKTAVELDPLSVAVNQIAGSILYFAGREVEAIERLERAIEIDPSAAFAHDNLGLARCHEGKVDEALAEIKKAMELDPNNVMLATDLCYAYARAGRPAEARDVLARTEADKRSNPALHVPPVALAGMHASLGETDRALEWLEDAFSEHSPYLSSLNVESWFDGIRTDPRFTALLERVGLGRKVTVAQDAKPAAKQNKDERLASNLLTIGYRRVEDKLPIVLGETVSFRLTTYNEDSSQYIVCDYCEQATKATVERLLDKLKLLARSNFDYKVKSGILLSDREPPNEVKEYATRVAGAKYPVHVVSDPDGMSELVP